MVGGINHLLVMIIYERVIMDGGVGISVGNTKNSWTIYQIFWVSVLIFVRIICFYYYAIFDCDAGLNVNRFIFIHVDFKVGW